MTKTGFQFKPLFRMIVASAGGAVLAGVILIAPMAMAQDNSGFKPHIETTYRSVQDGTIVRMVPQSRVVYSNQVGDVTYPAATAPRSLPHADEIGPLVDRILLGSFKNTDLGQEQLADSKPTTSDQLKTQLEQMLGDQFDAMSDAQQTQISQLAERLEKLKAQHQARSEARDEIIARRMNELLRKPDPLAWDPNGVRHSGPTVPYGNPTTTGTNSGLWMPQPARVPQSLPMPAPYVPSTQYGQPGQAPAYPSTSTSNDAIRPQLPRFDPWEQNPSSQNSSAQYDYITKSVEQLYGAIGRYSVDNTSENVEQIQAAVRQAETSLKQASESLSTLRTEDQKREFSKQIEN
ncbi:MAG: hypothetical protein KDB00_03125, partial [Planctomycetales bacterium]|nr:hypothetical protein [Planctomycetales bacterium]